MGAIMRTAKRSAITDLSCESVDTKPIDYSWSPKRYDHEESGEGWTSREGCRCDACGEVLVLAPGMGNESHRDVDGSKCEGHVPTAEGPMMNYFYPLSGLTDDDAAKLADTCLCVAIIDGETGLALTGGGMDLSWEICEAFMLLGHLPPFHFCDLPRMSGKGVNARDRWIVSGALKSCEVAASWATSRADRVRDMVRRARKEAKPLRSW
jgi:hypothetical protein